MEAFNGSKMLVSNVKYIPSFMENMENHFYKVKTVGPAYMFAMVVILKYNI